MKLHHKTQKLLGSNLGQLLPTFTQYNTPFQVVDKAIGGEEMIQTWLDESNCRAERYFESGTNMEEEETAQNNDYPPGSGDNARQKKLYGSRSLYAELMM